MAMDQAGQSVGVPDSTIKDDRLAEVEKEEKALVLRILDRIKNAKRSMGDFENQIDIYRKYVAGKQGSDTSGEVVRANLIHANIKKSTHRIYARNPEFSVKPTEQVSEEGYKKWRLFGKTMEIVLNQHFDDAGLKRTAKSAVRASKTSRIGWVKLGYYKKDGLNPEFPEKLNDTEEKLAHLKKLRADVKDQQALNDLDVQKERLETFLETLKSEEEAHISHGLRFNNVDTKNIVLDISSIFNFDDYSSASFIDFLFKVRERVQKF